MEKIAAEEHELVVRVEDAQAGLLSYIAIHSTRRGPAVGGLRMRPYGSEAEARDDVLRLSRGMTYKNAAAELPLSGGKAVILGDPAARTPAMLRAFGAAVDRLGGRYWTAEDMGVGPADMAVVAQATRFVAGLTDGDHASGDPSPVTAQGVFNGIRSVARHRLGSGKLAGRRVAVQGLGHVGRALAGLLAEAGATLVVADTDPARVREAVASLGAAAVAPDRILGAEADILAPCAVGAVLNRDTIPLLKVAAVAGAANNQLATAEDAARLAGRGILYAPDFVVNGGGVINVATEILRIREREAWVAEKLAALDRTLDRILTRAGGLGVSPNDVAEEIVRAALTRDAA